LLKVLNSYTFRHSMIRPSRKVNLCNFMLWSILFDSRQFPPFKVLTLLSMLYELYLYPFFVFIILRNKEFELTTILARPELVAFISTVFFSLACTYNHCDILFNYHLPKLICSLWEWTLTRNDFPITFGFIVYVLKRWVDITRINVIRLWDLIENNTSVQLHSAFVVGQDIWVPVALLVDFFIICQQTLDHNVLFKKLFQNTIFCINVFFWNWDFLFKKIFCLVGFHELLVLLNQLESHIIIFFVPGSNGTHDQWILDLNVIQSVTLIFHNLKL
jgi:hypothetical protein